MLEPLGVNLDAEAECVGRCLRDAGVCFCYAIRHHPAMKHAGPVRKALGVRTIFNLLGPLTNPAGAKRQVVGVFDAELTETMAHVLGALGAVRAMVVHAEDGLDELSTCSATKISELKDGEVATRTLTPEDFAFKRITLDDLSVESAAESARAIREVLSGKDCPAREIVILNAAAALAVGGKADDIASAIPLATESIDSGTASDALQKLIETSNS